MSKLSSITASTLDSFTATFVGSRNASVAITNSTNQTLSGATPVPVVFGTTAVASSGASLSVSGNTIVVNDAGRYNVVFDCQLTPSAAGVHAVTLLNGATVLHTQTITVATVSVPYTFSVDQLFSLAAGSVLSLTATQASGATVISGSATTRASLIVRREF